MQFKAIRRKIQAMTLYDDLRIDGRRALDDASYIIFMKCVGKLHNAHSKNIAFTQCHNLTSLHLSIMKRHNIKITTNTNGEHHIYSTDLIK